MRLWRAHGLGNDYLVQESGPSLTAELVRAVCDRHRGVGSDGILQPHPSDRADRGVRIWNPDGSIAEKSGNGLRIFARWCAAHGAGARFTVDTGFDVVDCAVPDDGPIHVAMGRALIGIAPGFVGERVRVAGHTLTLTTVSVGNPHCVAVFARDTDLDALPWRQLGAALETDPRFPDRTNVQIARFDDDGVHIRIWERGAGETQASGSSSCAAAAVAVAQGAIAPGPIAVHMPGGTLQVTVTPNLEVHLAGPVEVVGTVEVDAAWLALRHRP